MERYSQEIARLKAIAREVQGVFKEFVLGGGTAIMFRYAHQLSTDLDFFTYEKFSFSRLLSRAKRFLEVEGFEIFTDNVDIYIKGIKVSFILFPLPSLNPHSQLEGINIMNDYDLFLNKVYAAGRRVVWKDPFDAAFLWERHNWPVAQLKRDFRKKFPGQSWEIFLGALVDMDSYPALPEECRGVLRELERASLEDLTS